MMTTEVATRRVLRRGFPSPLALPCYADDAGAPVPYPALSPAERVRLAIALHDYLHEVTRIVSTRCVALQSDVLCIIDAVVQS